MPQTRLRRKPRVAEKITISLRRDQIAAIRQIAEADEHWNVSRVVQEAVDAELDRRRALTPTENGR